MIRITAEPWNEKPAKDPKSAKKKRFLAFFVKESQKHLFYLPFA